MRRLFISFILPLLTMGFLFSILRVPSVKSGSVGLHAIQTVETSNFLAYKYFPQDCLRPEDIVWKQFPLRNEWQKENTLLGGEGMQWVHDFDWNRNDTDILYLVTDTTRVWKSIDRGNSWFPVGQDLRIEGGVSIVSDPRNPDVVLLAASEFSLEYRDDFADGIYRSLDGGHTWTGPIDGRRKYGWVDGNKFLFDQDSFNGSQCLVIYAASSDGVLSSSDGGTSWENLTLQGQTILDIEWSDANRSFFYATTNWGHFYRVDIATNTTSQLGNGLPSAPILTWDMAVSSEDPSLVYAVAGNSSYISYDGGLNFSTRNNGTLRNLDYERITVSPVDPNRLLLSPAGTGGMYPYWTEDGGETWHNVHEFSTEEFLTVGYYYPEAKMFDPENAEVAIAKFSGTIAKTYDGGRTWNYSGEGYSGARVKDISFIDKSTMLFSLTDYGLYLSENGGQSFRDLNLERVDGMKSCGSADMSDDLIIASSGGWSHQDIVMSEDKGNTWSNVLSAEIKFDFIRFNSENDSIVYANNYTSHDKGVTWNVVNDGYEIRAKDLRNASIVYGTKQYSSWQMLVGRSEDSGETWEQLGSPIRTIFDLAVDPHGSDIHLLAAVGWEGIYEYLNGSWFLRSTSEGLGPKLNSQGILYVWFDPTNPGIAWAARTGWYVHSDGVYFSTNGGGNWTNVVNNLGPFQDFWNIDINPFDGTVYLTGPGVWTFSFNLLAGDIDGDFDVDIFDIIIIAYAYGSSEGEPEFNPDCDLNCDYTIDLFDVVIAVGNYGEQYMS